MIYSSFRVVPSRDITTFAATAFLATTSAIPSAVEPVMKLSGLSSDPAFFSSSIKELEKKAGSELKPDSFITGSTADGMAEVVAKNAVAANVVMSLEGTTRKDEYIIVGAHY